MATRRLNRGFLMVSAFVLIVVPAGSVYGTPWTWTTLDFPGARQTQPYAVSGNNVVGWYQDNLGQGGWFLYDGASWTRLYLPNPARAQHSEVTGISGSSIAGYYLELSAAGHAFGFINGTTVTCPGACDTEIWGIDASSIVGRCKLYSGNSYRWHGFFSDGGTWIALDYPGATAESTWPRGISGNSIVGSYQSDRDHGFIYDGMEWKSLDYPGAAYYTYAYGISGNNIVGSYSGNPSSPSGFLYNGTTWTTLNYPGASCTSAQGIDGNNIVGWYQDNSGVHGFLLTIPEPATMGMLVLGLLPFLQRRPL